MSLDFTSLRDKLIKEQDEAHTLFNKSKVKKKQVDVGQKVHELGEQINTISHVALELVKHGIENPVINFRGRCYGCGKIIDLENEECKIYQSNRNQSISLFHPRCDVPTAGGPILKGTIGKSTRVQTSEDQ